MKQDCWNPDIMVVDTMMQSGFSSTSAAAIYDACSVLWSGFNEVSVEYFNREANKVAHELARNVFSSKYSGIWVDEPPSFILSTLVETF